MTSARDSVAVGQLAGPGAVIDVGRRVHIVLDDRLTPGQVRTVLAVADAFAQIRRPIEPRPTR